MSNNAIPRFSAELASASSRPSIIMSGHVDGYSIEQLLETAQRYARRVRVRLDGAGSEGAMRLLESCLARLVSRGIEVTLARG